MQRSSWTQLSLLFGAPAQSAPESKPSASPSPVHSEEAHRRRILGFLTIRLPSPVDLVFTDNHSTMISYAHRQGRYQVRLHRMFRHADSALLEHLARFIVGKGKSDSDALDLFISDHTDEIRRRRRVKSGPLHARGVHHDLQAILDRVTRTYFDGCADVRIGWSAPPRRRKSRRRNRAVSRALATYNYEDKTIRVSPVLDAGNVPEYVVEWIVYHEMLHHVLPVEKVGGKNRFHTPKFRMLERAFKDFEKAKAWEVSHLEQLLR